MSRPGPSDIITDFLCWGEWKETEDGIPFFVLYAATPRAYVYYALSEQSARLLVNPEYADAHLKMIGMKLWDLEDGREA